MKAVKGQKLVKTYMTRYGRHVIEDRAVPDFRDGFKPVQRKIMWVFQKYGYTQDKPFRKTTDITGKVMAEFHPHASCEKSISTLIHDRYSLLEGHGNWGDPQRGKAMAAPRYVEVRMDKKASWLFDCKEIGEYVKNYTDELDEPLVISSRLPLLLLNGSEGIGVGLSCCFPPHNATEVFNGFKELIKNPKMTTKELMSFIKAPDYGQGVLLSSKKEVLNLYKEGKGSLRYGCDYTIRKYDKYYELVITSFAPALSADPINSNLVKKLKEFEEKDIIDCFYDETSLDNGIRYVIRYQNSTLLTSNVLPLLEISIPYEFYVTERSKDSIEVYKVGLKNLMLSWIEYRKSEEIKYLKLQEDKTLNKIAREEAILKAINNIDIIADALKKDNTEDIIKKKLKLTDFQVEVIMNTTVRALKKKNAKDVNANITNLNKELKTIRHNLKHIADYIIDIFDRMQLDFENDKRGTLLKTKDVEIKGEKSGGLYAISNGKNLRKLSKVTGAFKLNSITKDGEGVTTVNDHAIVGHWGLMDIPDSDVDSKYGPIVGIVPYSKKAIVSVTNLGNVSVIAHEPGKDGYKTIKLRDNEYVIKVLGINKGESLVVYTKDRAVVVPYAELKLQRNNTLGHSLLKKAKNVEIAVFGKDSIASNTEGEKIDIKSFTGGTLYIVNEENYVDKQIKDKKSTLRFLKKYKPSIYITIA